MNKNEYYRNKVEAFNEPERLVESVPLPGNPKKFHIIGICGTAMGALAGLLRDKGYEVSGSDQACFPPISDMLETLDVDVHTGNYEALNIAEDVDITVIGNVSTPKNPEAAHVRENNLPFTTLPDTLRDYVFGDAKRIVVAGTHGKTTTTGIVTALFDTAKKNPGFMIGGVPQGKEKGFSVGNGDYAIFEGDEYDTSYFNKMPKFLQYGAHTGIVTSLELDHLDIYSDLEDYTQAFNYFAQDIPKDGFLFINGDDDVLTHLKDEAKQCMVRTYGFNDSNDIYGKYMRTTPQGTQVCTVVVDGEELGEIETPLPGLYNIANCLGALGIALVHGISFEDIQKGLRIFGGMKRRQEVVCEVNGITLIDDFAHHPTSVKATLAGIKEKYAQSETPRRLVAIFEPRSNSSRKKIFEKDYVTSFDSADVVFLKTPKLRHNDDADDFISPEAIKAGILARNENAQVFTHENVDALAEDIMSTVKEGDIVMMMSNGNFDGLKGKLEAKLKEKS